MWCVCVCVWGVCGKTDYTATLKVFRVRVLSMAKKYKKIKLKIKIKSKLRCLH